MTHYLDFEPTRLPEDAQADRDTAHTERLRDAAIEIWNHQIRIMLHEAANKNWHGECPVVGYGTREIVDMLTELLVPSAEAKAAAQKLALVHLGWGRAA